ncbi:MAG TPA: helicase-related protein, partial [Sulfuricaulis sp.]|nr:helicase-related protein [Sulfuricaulis sp.]
IYHPVDRVRKRELLSHLIHSQGWKQVLVFTRTKHGANRLADQLDKDGISSSAIHGNKSQGARTKALADFKKNEVRVLVATDIAARGLDIDQLPHVVNYELPNVPEDYVHRIGRTGRAGKEGQAVSLVCVDERDYLRDIERLLKRDVPKVVIEGFEPDPSIKAEPISHGRGQRGGGRPQGQRRGGEQRRQQQPQSRSLARDGGPCSPSNPPSRSGGQRPHSDSQPRSAGHRPHSHSQARAGGPRSHAPHHRPATTHHAHGHTPREDVDGNRRTPEHPNKQSQVRSSFSKSERSSRRTRSTASKGTVRRSW